MSVVQSDKSHKSASDQEWDYGRLWKQGQRGMPLCTFITIVKVITFDVLITVHYLSFYTLCLCYIGANEYRPLIGKIETSATFHGGK